MRPINNQIQVKLLPEPEEKSASGLLLPTAKRAYNRGKVIAFDPALDGRIESGDIVLIAKANHGTSVIEDGVEYRLIHASSVLSIE